MHLDINNNPLSKRAERRYAFFTEIQKRQIGMLNNMTWKEYQLNVMPHKPHINYCTAVCYAVFMKY